MACSGRPRARYRRWVQPARACIPPAAAWSGPLPRLSTPPAAARSGRGRPKPTRINGGRAASWRPSAPASAGPWQRARHRAAPPGARAWRPPRRPPGAPHLRAPRHPPAHSLWHDAHLQVAGSQTHLAPVLQAQTMGAQWGQPDSDSRALAPPGQPLQVHSPGWRQEGGGGGWGFDAGCTARNTVQRRTGKGVVGVWRAEEPR